MLTIGVDYTVKYKNNKKEGNDAEVTVIGKGNYAGKEVTKKFTIKAVDDVKDSTIDLKGAKLAKIDAQPYTGAAIYPNFKLTLKGEKTAVEYKYDTTTKQYVKVSDNTPDVNVAVSNNVNKGTATILVTGAKDAKDKITSVKKTFKITPVDLSKATETNLKVEVANSVSYAVKGATPTVKVSYNFINNNKDNWVTLVSGKDYTVKYSANKKVGKGKVTITGKGNYSKKVAPKEFNITNLSMADTKLVAVTAYTDLKAGKVKATVVDANGDMLKASQYTVKVCKDAGGKNAYGTSEKLTKEAEIYVIAEAKDTKNLTANTATKPVNFVVGENIAKAKVKLTVKSKPYTGAKVTLKDEDLEVTLKIKGQKTPETLKMSDGDFKIVSYSNNINKGTATAVIQGTGKYSGTKTIKFKITAKEMKKPT